MGSNNIIKLLNYEMLNINVQYLMAYIMVLKL